MAGGFTANLQVELELGKSRTIQQLLWSLLRSQIWPQLVRALFLMEKMYRKFVSFTRYHPFPHVDSSRISPILDDFVEHRIGQKTKKLGGQGPWSFQSIREFLRNIIFWGLWALPGQIGGSIVVGAKKVGVRKNMPIHERESMILRFHSRTTNAWMRTEYVLLSEASWNFALKRAQQDTIYTLGLMNFTELRTKNQRDSFAD